MLEHPRKRFKEKLQLGWLLVWFGAVAAPLGYLMAFHMAPLSGALTVAKGEGSLNVPRPAGQWAAIHVLSADCECSKQLAEKLLTRGPVDGLAQKITLIGKDDRLIQRFRQKGYLVEKAQSEELLSRFGVRATPLLILLKPNNEIAYSGGYSKARFSAGEVSRDIEILAALKEGRSIASLPIFGCANGKSVRAAQDPLGLKYR